MDPIFLSFYLESVNEAMPDYSQYIKQRVAVASDIYYIVVRYLLLSN